MRKAFALTAAAAIFAAALSSCEYGNFGDVFFRAPNVRERAKAVARVEGPDTPKSGTYSVAVVSDLHFGRGSKRSGDSHKDREKKFLGWLEGLPRDERPRFALCLGDIAEHGEEDEYEECEKYFAELEKIDTGGGNKLKIYFALGNHDLFNDGWKRWKRGIMRSSFYSFSTGNLSWYALDTANGAMGPAQLEAFADALKSDPNPKIVFSHYPVYAGGNFYYCLQDTTERNLLIHHMAKGGARAFFSGHTHSENSTDFGAFVEYNVPGFLDFGKWALATIDAASGEIISVETKGNAD